MLKCPNINSPENKELIEKIGLKEFYRRWLINGDNMNRNVPIKPGVTELFESNSELASIGTPQQYSQYLDTIFPDSKVKDIVYHGTLDKFESFDKSKIGKNIIKDRPKGFYFTRKNVAENIYGSYPSIDASTGEQILQKGNLISVIINTKGQYQSIQEKDDVSGYGDFVEYESHVVFEPEQIHILGSKQDIEGFKQFTENKDLEPDSDDAFTKRIQEDSGLIEGFTGPQQNSISKYFTAEVVKARKEGKKGINALNDLFKKYEQAEAIKRKAGDLKVANEVKKILDNRKEFELLVNFKLNQLSYQALEEDIDEDLSDGKERNVSKEAYEEDPFASTSPRLRSLFFMVEDLNPDGSKKKNYLGMPLYKEASDIVPRLQVIANNLEYSEKVNTEKLIAAFESKYDTDPWLRSVVSLLKERDERYTIELAKFLSKHEIEMKTAIVNDTGKEVRLQSIDTNLNSLVKEIRRKWLSNQLLLPLVEQVDDNLVLNTNERNKLIEDYKELMKSPSIEGIQKWLKRVGVEVDIKALEYMKSAASGTSKYFDNVSFEKHFTDSKGWFKKMFDTLLRSKGDGENSLSINNPLFSNRGVAKLAELHARFETVLSPTSFLNGENKTISSFSNNKHAVIQFKRLMEDPGFAEKALQSAFTKNSWYLKMLAEDNQDFKNKFSFGYSDTIKIKSSNDDSKPLDAVNDDEFELARLTHFFSDRFFFPTMSDKKAIFILDAPKKNVRLVFDKDDFYLSKEIVDEIFKSLESELLRNDFLQNNGKQNIAGFDSGVENQYLFYFPEINTKDENDPNFIPGLWKKIGEKKYITNYNADVVANLKSWLSKKYKNLIKEQIQDWKDLQIIDEKNLTKYIDSTYLKELDSSINTPEKKILQVAADYVANYAIAKHNMFQAFTDDPLFYFKKNIEETWINLGKRLASENAPGFDLINVDNQSYRQVFFSDPEMVSSNIEYYKKLGLSQDKIESYSKIDATDAQEYTTLQEHLYIMYHTGKMYKEDYDKLLTKANKGEDFSKEELGILQPMKPVFRETKVDNHLNRPIYIKTASFPLVPQLTRGLNIDNLLKFVQANNIDRIVFKSGAKVGLPDVRINPFDKDFNFSKDIIFDEKAILELPRTGLRIQQEVPYDETKAKINIVTQADKLITADLPERLNVLVDKYLSLKRSIYKLNVEAVYKEFGVEETDDTFKFNFEKLSKALIREGLSRNYSINDLKGLELKDGKFVTPLLFNGSSEKVQAALSAIIDKRIRKLKMPGFSGILGSEAGFSPNKEYSELTQEQRSDVVFLDPSKTSLDHDEILVPFKFRDLDGNLLDLKDFIDESGKLDTKKVPKDVLRILGFRIPNQGKNSMLSIKIAGFLPTYMGDLVIASKDLTKQMGSDFDVDKLYMYMYNTLYNKYDGVITKLSEKDYQEVPDDMIFTEEEMFILSNLNEEEMKEVKKSKKKEYQYQNEIIDVFHDILTDKDVIKQVKTPLGFGYLPDVKEEVLALKPKSSLDPLSPKYDRKKYLSARGGKAGTGVYSVSNTFNAVIQDRNIYVSEIIEVDDKPKKVEKVIYFTKRGNRLSDRYVQGTDRPKSEVHSAFQSAAVDEEKEQLLSSLNINTHTFDVTTGAAQSGFDEYEISLLINQPVVEEYINQVISRSSSLNDDVDFNADVTVLAELLDKYSNLSDHTYKNEDTISVDEMKTSLKNDVTTKDFYKIQYIALNKFAMFKQIGKDIRQIASSINVDSKGLPKDIAGIVNKVEQIKNLPRMVGIMNAQNAIGIYSDSPSEGYVKIDNEFYIYPETIPGMATAYGLGTAYKMYKDLIPYESPNFKALFSWVEELSGKKIDTPFKKSEFMNSMAGILKSFFYTLPEMGLYSGDVVSQRNNLLRGDNSLAKRVLEFQKYSSNKFIRRLIPEISLTPDGFDVIKFNAATRETLDEPELYRDFAQMFITEDTRALAEDLVTYSYITGGLQQAVQYAKFVPFAYLNKINFIKDLNKVNTLFSMSEVVLSPQKSLEQFGPGYVPDIIQQIIQHYPEYSTRIYRKKDLTNPVQESKNLGNYPPSEKQLETPGRDNKRLVSFEPSDKTLYVDGEKKGLPKEIVSVKENGELYPFLYNYETNTYNRIDKLGKFPILEFNAGGSGYSIVEQNKASYVPVQKQTVNNFTPVAALPLPNPIAKESYLLKYDIEDKEPLTLESLDKMYDAADAYHKPLLQVLKDNFNLLGDIKVYMTEDLQARAAYNSKDKSLFINPSKVNKTDEQLFFGTIAEELFHGLTSDIIKNPQTDSQKQIVSSITSLVEFVRKKLIEKYPEEFAAYAAKLNGNSLKQGVKLTQREIDLFYGTLNEREFVAQAFRRPEFQKLLNSIEYGSDKKTLLERFVELLKSALKTINIDVKPNTALDAAVNNMFSLLEKKEVKEEISSNSKGILGALTNPTELAKSKGNIAQSYPVTFRGVTYKDAESAYQALKNTATKDDGPNNTYNLIVDIIKAKFEQHPRLLNEVTKLGGSQWILSKTHQPTKQNTVWETGGKNWFIKALNEAYIKVQNKSSETIGDYTIHFMNGTYDVEHNQDGIVGEYLPTLDAAKEAIEKHKNNSSIVSQKTVSSPIYKDAYGNFYKFDLLEEDPETMIRGYYSQGSPDNWKEMNNKTAMRKFYDEFEELLEYVEKKIQVSGDNKITINGVTIDTGNITPNEQQLSALQSIANFVDNPAQSGWENSSFSLVGYAGTGKTTITKFIVQYLKKKGKNYSLNSPTHRAKEVLQDLTGESAMTVAKALGLAPGVDLDNYNLVDKQFQAKGDVKIPRNGIMIIDEASMVNDELFNMIIKEAENKGTKVLFIGDDAQLKPVKQKDKGKAFRRDKNMSKLTKVMRTADGNPMPAEVLQPIRDNPTSKVDMFEHKTKLSEKGEGIIFTNDSSEWAEKMLERFSLTALNENPNYVRALAYTNDRVENLNSTIRAKMFGIGANDFYKDELLMMYENLYYTPSGDYLFPNGMDVKIKDIEYMSDYKIYSPSGKSFEVIGHKLTFTNVKTGRTIPQDLFVGDVSKINSDYIKELVDLKNKALTASPIDRGRLWSQYYDFSASYSLTNNVWYIGDIATASKAEARKIAGKLYPQYTAGQLETVVNKAMIKAKSLDYAYAHTIHKSQGGTYEYAFVDENNIDIIRKMPNSDYEMLNQLKYVGFSRSSKQTVVLSGGTSQSFSEQIVPESSLSLPTDDDVKNGIKQCSL